MYVYVCMYMYIYMCVYVYVYIYMCIYIHVYVYIIFYMLGFLSSWLIFENLCSSRIISI